MVSQGQKECLPWYLYFPRKDLIGWIYHCQIGRTSIGQSFICGLPLMSWLAAFGLSTDSESHSDHSCRAGFTQSTAQTDLSEQSIPGITFLRINLWAPVSFELHELPSRMLPPSPSLPKFPPFGKLLLLLFIFPLVLKKILVKPLHLIFMILFKRLAVLHQSHTST